MLPAGLAHRRRLAPVRRGPRASRSSRPSSRRSRARAARRASARPTRCARPPSSSGPISWLRGLAGLAALAAGIVVLAASRRRSREHAPAAAMVWMVAVALLGPLLALAVRLADRPAPARCSAAGPGLLACANSRANLRRVASVATPMMLAISLGLHDLLRQDDRSSTRRRSRRPSARRPRYVLRARRPPGLPADVAAAARPLPGVAEASGTFATSVVVAAGGTNLRSFPARAVDAATLAGVVDLGVVSGSLRRPPRSEASPSARDSATRFGWHVGDRVRVLARRRHAGDAARRRQLRRARSASATSSCRAPLAERPRHDMRSTTPSSSARSPVPIAARARAGSRRSRGRMPGVEVVTRSQYERRPRAGRAEAVVRRSTCCSGSSSCSARSRVVNAADDGDRRARAASSRCCGSIGASRRPDPAR